MTTIRRLTTSVQTIMGGGVASGGRQLVLLGTTFSSTPINPPFFAHLPISCVRTCSTPRAAIPPATDFSWTPKGYHPSAARVACRSACYRAPSWAQVRLERHIPAHPPWTCKSFSTKPGAFGGIWAEVLRAVCVYMYQAARQQGCWAALGGLTTCEVTSGPTQPRRTVEPIDSTKLSNPHQWHQINGTGRCAEHSQQRSACCVRALVVC